MLLKLQRDPPFGKLSIQFNHLILFAKDKRESADFLTDLLGLPEPEPSGAFIQVQFSNGVTLNYAEPGTDFPGQHYAFLVSGKEFNDILNRVKERNVPFWADPQMQKPGEVYHRPDEETRGVYFLDPAGHYMEVFMQFIPGPANKTTSKNLSGICEKKPINLLSYTSPHFPAA